MIPIKDICHNIDFAILSKTNSVLELKVEVLNFIIVRNPHTIIKIRIFKKIIM